MKKIIKFAILISFLSGCDTADNDCSAWRHTINERYDEKIQSLKDNPTGPNGKVDHDKIALLNIERNKKLDEACK